MGKFAELVQALTTQQVRTLVDVLFGTLDAGLTVAKYSKITANTLTMPYKRV